MNLSPLHQALVELENSSGLSKQSFDEIFKSKSRGILGKMEAMDLIGKSPNSIKLSSKGKKYLNSILDNLHKPLKRWEGNWTVISFSIPEKKRGVRDKFRRYIDNLGLKPVFNSFWISPFNMCPQIIDYAKHNKIENSVACLITDRIYGITKDDILKNWDFEKFRKRYEDFIAESENILNKKNENIVYKKQILKFALLISEEPKVPLELLPKDWPRFRANLYYKKLRNRLSK